MHKKHGAYYLVRDNKWTHLGRSLGDALTEYARLTTGPEKGAFPDLVSRSLADLKITIAESTYNNYFRCARRVLHAFQNFTPEQVRPHHIARFLDAHKATPGMANMFHSFLRDVFKRAVRWGIVEADPTRDIDRFKLEDRDRYITEDEYAAIRAHANPTLACLMDLAYLTGQRMIDLRKLAYADITPEGIFFRQQKTKTRMRVSMTPDLAEVISRARALHKSVKGLTLFSGRAGKILGHSTINGWWLKACRDAGVEDARFHDLRAAAGTDAYDEGRDSKTLLGHKTESSHNKYLRSRRIKVATPNKQRIS
jgi:integrase